MKSFSPPLKVGVQRALMALTLTTACSATWALPVFTLDPSAAGLNGSAVTADNILISDYSTVRFDGSGGVTDSGFLAVSGFQLASAATQAPGLDTTYGLFFSFDASGTQTVGTTPSAGFTAGTFDSVTFELRGYNGAGATFGFDGANNPTTTAAGTILLASGSLVPGTGSFSTSPAGGGLFRPDAGATLTFNVAAGAEGFFADPTPFYNLAFSAFTNTVSQVEIFDGGFRIRQGGGAVNFDNTAPIPEPGTYALMLAGLAAIGTVVRRRRQS